MEGRSNSSTSLTDVDMDSLVHCASYLSLRDLSNMSISCKYLQKVAYSDGIWQSLFRKQWLPSVPLTSSQTSSVREAYIARHTALQQFKFIDPFTSEFCTVGKPPDHILLDKDDIIFSQGPFVRVTQPDSLLYGGDIPTTCGSHNARITCMRLFPASGTAAFQNEAVRNDNVLVTSSCDRSIRLWWKGGCYRCFKGHTAPVTTLSDKLLTDDNGKIFASGGQDGTVRLWSISSSGKRGQHALKATLHGHDKSLSLLSVAGHKTSLLVSISKNSQVRVWDTTAASSSVRSSCCVGMISVPGAPVGMKCHESLLYVGTSSSVVIIDLRTMRKVSTIMQQEKVHSFDVLPSRSLMCTGATGRATLWDIRRNSDAFNAEPIAELDGHMGPVKHLHIDPYKVVTSGPDDANINVWEANTGARTNSFLCCSTSGSHSGFGCSAMAVDGYRMVSASGDDDLGVVCYRDFNPASCQVPSDTSGAGPPVSKFWGSPSCSDTEEEPDD